MSIDTIKQDLESAIDNSYQKIDSEVPVAIISQMITNRVCHSCYYSLLDNLLINKYFSHHSKIYLLYIDLLYP